MRLGLRELRRKPSRFAVAGTMLVLLTVLLLFLGGLLDGLYLGSTGALRAQQAELVTFSNDARQSLVRSRIDADTRAQVEAVSGVEQVHGLGLALVGGEVPGRSEPANLAVLGFEQPVRTMKVTEPPPPGQAIADRSLQGSGVELGQTVLVGPSRIPVEVVGWVDDTNFLLQGGFWVEPGTWRTILAESRPDANLPDDTFQALVVTTTPGADPAAVAAAIDQATGTTDTLTRADAVLALPGIKEQDSTFSSIIYSTFAVALLVVALFFALLTLERIGMYAVFKAIGASSGQIFGGVLAQAAVVGVVSFLIGAALVLVSVQFIPPGAIPIQVETPRVVQTLVGIVLMAVLGSALSLRRVVKVDPASAIG